MIGALITALAWLLIFHKAVGSPGALGTVLAKATLSQTALAHAALSASTSGHSVTGAAAEVLSKDAASEPRGSERSGLRCVAYTNLDAQGLAWVIEVECPGVLRRDVQIEVVPSAVVIRIDRAASKLFGQLSWCHRLSFPAAEGSA